MIRLDVNRIVPIERHVLTPFGEADADFMLVPDSPDFATEFCCWLFETNECWWFPQTLVRAVRGFSAFKRGKSSDIVLSDALFERYARHILRHKQSPFYERAVAYLRDKP